MKRLVVALAAVAVLAVGTASFVFAQTPTPQQGQPGSGCWGSGTYGNYDPSTNPTIKRLADKIGIGAADLVQQLKSGKSVVDVAGSKVSEQDLVNVLLQPQIDILNVQVKNGYLTQDQANAAQQYMTDRAKLQLEQKGLSSGWGFGGMMGGFGGMMGGGFGGPGFGPRAQSFSY